MNLIKSPTLTLSRDLFSLTPEALAQKEAALVASAPIGRVSNKAENDAAAAARKGLRTLSSAFEKQRKDLTEPFLEAQRAIMRLVTAERDELDREDARIEELMKTFAKEELRLKREAEEAQQRELERIEREKQAEIDRLRREQEAARLEAERIERERQAEVRRIAEEAARKEREAKAAQEAIEREAREAKSKAERQAAERRLAEAREAQAKADATAKAEREAAERAAAEAESKRLAAEAEAAKAIAAVEQAAAHATYIESKPSEMTRAHGQTVRKIWKITQINDFQLMKARPDLVRNVEWDIAGIKEALNSGQTLPGVTAEEDLKVGVRGSAQKTIEV